MTEFEKIAHLIRFGLSFRKMTKETVINWADNKIIEKDSNEIFLDISTSNNVNKIIEILSVKVNWDFNDKEIRSLVLSYYKEYLKATPNRWEKIEEELLCFYNLIENKNIDDKSQDFLYYLGDDVGLRKDGFGGILEMPEYLIENLSEYENYKDLQELLSNQGLSGFKL